MSSHILGGSWVVIVGGFLSTLSQVIGIVSYLCLPMNLQVSSARRRWRMRILGVSERRGYLIGVLTLRESSYFGALY